MSEDPRDDARDDTVLVVQHQDDAGPGNLGSWLDASSIPWQLVDASTGALPAPRRRRALIVLGSREAAYDEAVPWLAAEREFVRATIALGTPVLGICFGAQLLAQVLGGSVHRAGTLERGWIPIAPTAAAYRQGYADVIDRTWFEWHGDEIDLPPGATLLAGGSCVQAYAHGVHLGVQFHPEVTEIQLDQWMAGDRRLRQLTEAGGERAALLADTAKQLPDAIPAAGRLYGRFLRTS